MNECAFFRYKNYKQNGLIDDMETLPQIILQIKFKDGNLEIEETQFTKDYLFNNA